MGNVITPLRQWDLWTNWVNAEAGRGTKMRWKFCEHILTQATTITCLYTQKGVCTPVVQDCRHSWAIWKVRFILKVTEFLWKWYFLLFLHLRNVQWKTAAEMLNSSFSKTAHWVTVHYIILELKESRTKTHFHNFGGINVPAMPQYLQCMFLATTFTVFLKSKVNQQSIALYFSFYWSLQWRCQNIVSRVQDTSRFRRVINQMESN